MKHKIKPGMFFTIEPMVVTGSNKTRTLKDGWTVATADYSHSAHFEHTLAVKEDGQVEILT
jgi:methionyl aminopeptidase